MKKATAIVVDDEPGIASLTERVLSRDGYAVQAFTDPLAALAHLRKNHADLLVVDIRMPVLSGFDLIKEVQVIQPEMAILIMTGFGTVETAIQALRQGVDGLLLKPFEREEFLQAVNQAIADNQKKRDVMRIQALRPLFDVSEALLAETDPERLPGLILNAVRSHLNCTHAGLYEYNEADHFLHLRAGRGKTLPEEPSHPQGGAVGRAHALAQPVLLNRPGPGGDDVLNAQMRDFGLGAVMCVPTSLVNIRSVLFAGRDAGSPPFREVDLEMFTILSRQATVALENARLYKEVWDYVRKVEQSQQALVQAEKLATAGRMTASMAHEINNPLQAVRNCLHLAARAELGPEKQAEYLALAQSELERLSNTVQRMLNFYRPTSDRQSVDISALLDHVLSLLKQQLDEHHVEVVQKIAAPLPKVQAVANQIQQVFINILLNAMDAMPEGGKITITLQSGLNFLEILFQDSGPGVPSELRQAIFEPFTSTKEKGTGLGLSVSYGIISAHGGVLELVENDQPGACFRVALPYGEVS